MRSQKKPVRRLVKLLTIGTAIATAVIFMKKDPNTEELAIENNNRQTHSISKLSKPKKTRPLTMREIMGDVRAEATASQHDDIIHPPKPNDGKKSAQTRLPITGVEEDTQSLELEIVLEQSFNQLANAFLYQDMGDTTPTILEIGPLKEYNNRKKLYYKIIEIAILSDNVRTGTEALDAFFGRMSEKQQNEFLGIIGTFVKTHRGDSKTAFKTAIPFTKTRKLNDAMRTAVY